MYIIYNACPIVLLELFKLFLRSKLTTRLYTDAAWSPEFLYNLDPDFGTFLLYKKVLSI